MSQSMQTSRTERILLTLLVVGVLTVSLFGIFERLGVTDFYARPVSEAALDQPRPVNDVSYSPASPTDNDEINQQKESGQLGASQQQPSAGSPINVILNAAVQDVAKGPLVVRALITDATSGTCKLELTKGATTKTYTAAVQASGTYYNCAGFDVPATDLSSGTWQLKLTVTSGDRTGIAERTVEVTT